MEERLLELFDKMYVELQEVKVNMATKQDLVQVEGVLRQDIGRLEQDLVRVEGGLRQDIGRLEQDLVRVEDDLRQDLVRVEDGLRQDLVRVEDGLRQDIIRVEYGMEQNHKALFDGYHLLHEKAERIENRVEDIATVVKQHDIELIKPKLG